MQIPFEVDPPEKDKKSIRSSDTIKLNSETSSSINKLQKSISVTELTKDIKLILESKFSYLSVEGELSNVKISSSGHLYFILKDDHSQIRCVMFSQYIKSTQFTPENGIEVTVRGFLSVYKQRGEYQINISSMQPKGLGALQLAFDQLKIKLKSEGLFLDKHKKKIPFLPRTIGILTSPSGAVIHDMLTVLNHRFAEIPIIIFPVQVQGDLSVSSIVEGIKYLNSIRESSEIDLLILGRGGGSMEDLWSFNDETIARTIFSSKIPIISAIGHETDFTISDFVSDLRAPTPSAAIEIAVPKKKDLLFTLDHKQKQLNRSILQKISNSLEIFKALNKRLDSPINIVRQNSQFVDDLNSLLHERKNHQIEIMKKHYEILFEKFVLLNPKRALYPNAEKLDLLTSKLKNSIVFFKKELNEKIQQKIKMLDSLSPLSVIARGYTVTLNKKGQALKSVKETQPGEKLQVKMKDGIIQTKVTSIKS
tara:strand:- start:3595 stop:5031 length:1437 start_codon:yes stop_codon:yes gene_type:complete